MKEYHMRGLSNTFLNCLKTGFLSEITKYVRGDHDLNLEIRENYINVYYKGNSLLKLTEGRSLLHYKAEIHKKFLEEVNVSLDFTEGSVHQFIKNIPIIKQNIISHGKKSLELEYEQLIIRANNFEKRNNTEYYIVDRQYSEKEGRSDLSGIYWKTNGRKKYDEVPVCLIEIKFALNNDIKDVKNQLNRYYEIIKKDPIKFSCELQSVFRQKLALKLYDQEIDRLKAMDTLTFSNKIDDFQFLLVLVDYNPNSKLFDLEGIKENSFPGPIKVFRAGFGLWELNVTKV